MLIWWLMPIEIKAAQLGLFTIAYMIYARISGGAIIKLLADMEYPSADLLDAYRITYKHIK
jgi:hypothetical protein